MRNTEESITPMDAILFALILEVALQQIRILEGSTELRARHWNIADKTSRLQWDKLLKDREYAKNVIRTTILEVAERGEFYSIVHAVANLQQKANFAVDLRLRFENLKEAYSAIVSDFAHSQEIHKVQLEAADMKIAMLQDKIKDNQTNAYARLRYADKWLRAREESLELQQNIQPATLPKADHEIRVHEELVCAHELQIKEREKVFDYWRAKYVDDTASISKKVSTKREKLEIAVARREELQKLFDLHAGEIRSWLTFKMERAARLAREKRLSDAATLIQAWWRGVMVRRALGQFKYLRSTKKHSNKGKKK